MRGETIAPAAYRRIMAQMLAQPGGDAIDTVVLACTHFPLVQDELAAAAPRALTFVDGKEGIARRVAWLTRHRTWKDVAEEQVAIFTGGNSHSAAYGSAFRTSGFSRIIPI